MNNERTMKPYDPLASYSPSFTEEFLLIPSFSRRILAFLLDMLILSITILAPLGTLIESFFPHSENFMAIYTAVTENQTLATLFTVLMVFVCTLVVLYFTLSQYFVSQSIGQRFLHLNVIDTAGNRPIFWQCLLRNVVFLPVFPFALFWIIDPLYLLFAKQRLSEQLSRTRTIHVIP